MFLNDDLKDLIIDVNEKHVKNFLKFGYSKMTLPDGRVVKVSRQQFENYIRAANELEKDLD